MSAETAGHDSVGEFVPQDVFPNPLERAQDELADAFRSLAEQFAPGAASADWPDWPMYPSSDNPMPKLLRVGSYSRNRYPILVPALGEGHLALGRPELARHWVVPPDFGVGKKDRRNGATLQVTARDAQADAAQKEAQLNRQRLSELAAERPTATAAAVDLMARTVASMSPGSVSLTVYDPHDQGRAFRGFSPLAEHGLYNFVGLGEGRLSQLLEQLNGELEYNNTWVLQGFPSMRALVDITHQQAAMPWRLVAIFGNGETLSKADARYLNNVVKHGPACGISLITHGLDVPDYPPGMYGLHRVQFEGSQATVSTLKQIKFTLDGMPPPAAVRNASLAAVPKQRRDSVDPEPLADLPPADEYDYFLPGRRYSEAVDGLAAGVLKAREYLRGFEQLHPFLTANVLDAQLGRSERRFKVLLEAAGNDKAMLQEARATLTGPWSTTAERMAAWAALDLVRSAPGHRLIKTAVPALANLSITGPAAIEKLSELVGFTKQHNWQELPEDMQGPVWQRLPLDPPAWAFQLVADHGSRPSMLPNARRKAREALQNDVEAAFNCSLQDEDGRIDRELFNCLVECRLLQLHQFGSASPVVRELLTRRAHRHLEAIAPHEIPPLALPYYESCMQHLAYIGRIPTIRERLSERLGGAASAGEVQAEPNGPEER